MVVVVVVVVVAAMVERRENQGGWQPPLGNGNRWCIALRRSLPGCVLHARGDRKELFQNECTSNHREMVDESWGGEVSGEVVKKFSSQSRYDSQAAKLQADQFADSSRYRSRKSFLPTPLPSGKITSIGHPRGRKFREIPLSKDAYKATIACTIRTLHTFLHGLPLRAVISMSLPDDSSARNEGSGHICPLHPRLINVIPADGRASTAIDTRRGGGGDGGGGGGGGTVTLRAEKQGTRNEMRQTERAKRPSACAADGLVTAAALWLWERWASKREASGMNG